MNGRDENVIESPVDSQTLSLVVPTVAYRDSYIEMLKEHQAEGRFIDSRHIDNDVRRLGNDFDAFVASLLAAADPAQVRKGNVPEHFYWLIQENEVVGRSQLRREISDAPHLRDLGHIGADIRPTAMRRGLGKKILTLTLEHARAYRMDKVLVTCDSWNEASIRIIQSNGGIFDAAVPLPGRNYKRLRYWITL